MPIKWVRLAKYCELTGEPIDSVITRMKTGGWAKGVHYTVRARRRWVNLERAQEWVEKGLVSR